ncbi:zf-TFIIB domain-containing protein [Streptomyces sp. YIM 98790]|uniref:TFIIB-type zinc ribbon-containing protein n=1 Tax=Streptomyces sp. YIM 98790 TaxID=2689077 RepID=UPI0014091941|nr:zf-TFIIB domain-containing protein [Streptomyces sp. YIM 98790]
MQCPKCHAAMHTFNRSGVQIEQCSGCRGIFLDYGELEAITRLEGQQFPPQAAPPAPAPGGYAQPQPGYGQPAWGAPQGGHHGYRRKSFSRMLFSS